MNFLAASRVLGQIDARNVARDPLLGWMLILSLLLALAVRWGIPAISRWLLAEHGFDLSPYYNLIMSSGLLVAPVMIGTVIGFLLLDQRDDNTLLALRVTPLALNGYVQYRVALPTLISVPVSAAFLLLANLEKVDTVTLLATSICAAPMAAIFSLALASLARNKVQGFALAKASGIVTFPAMVAYFVQGPWQLSFGLTPTYWPVKAYWLGAGAVAPFWLHVLAGLAWQAVLVVVMARWFRRSVCR